MRAGISMRELDPKSPHALPACAVVGAGRLGTVLAAALSDAPALRRGEPVPPERRGRAAVRARRQDRRGRGASLPDGPLLGHCSGATGLDVFGAREGFSLHPLMSVPTGSEPAVLRGAGAAIDGTTAPALNVAATLRASSNSAAVLRRGRRRRRHARAARWPPHARSRARARDARHARRARGPRRLPRRGRDRGQLPGRARGLRRAARGHHRDHPRAARPARARHRRAVGAAGARGGADRARSRAATRARSSATARRSPSARRSCCAVWTELAEVTRAVAGRRAWT